MLCTLGETNVRTNNHGSGLSASPCNQSILLSLLKDEKVIDFLKTVRTENDLEFVKSAQGVCGVEKNIPRDNEPQNKKGEITDSETREKEQERLMSLLERYGVLAKNTTSSSRSSVVSQLGSTPDIISHELNSLMYSDEDLSEELGERLGSSLSKPSKSVAFLDEITAWENNHSSSSSSRDNLAITPRVRAISTNVEGSGRLVNR